MGILTIVGLGPGGMQYLTMEAYDALQAADLTWLRTDKHPIVDELKKRGIAFSSFDEMYEAHEAFDQVYEAIAQAVFKKVQAGDVTYAVPGNPFVAERTVERLQELCADAQIETKVVHGTSFLDAIITVLGKDPVHGLKVLDALQIECMEPDTKMDNMIIQVYDKMTGSRVKLELMKYYPDDHKILVVRGAGIPGEEVIREIPLYELDRVDLLDHLASLYIPSVAAAPEKKYFFQDLVSIMEALRSPEGCPWDREQTHSSLKPYLIEEAYEVLDAIDQDDVFLLEEELGDLLLQVVFHAQIAAESGYFQMNDVTTGICQKLIHRHPHVFADVEAETSEQVLTNWEDIKRKEKNGETSTASMERIPKGLPALMRAYKIQKKAAHVGFDWDDVRDAIQKIHEELDEFLEIWETGEPERVQEELGDLLFAVVNVCRFLKVRPEVALSHTNEKFIRRFSFVEREAVEKGQNLSNMTLAEMDKLWETAKKQGL